MPLIFRYLKNNMTQLRLYDITPLDEVAKEQLSTIKRALNLTNKPWKHIARKTNEGLKPDLQPYRYCVIKSSDGDFELHDTKPILVPEGYLVIPLYKDPWIDLQAIRNPNGRSKAVNPRINRYTLHISETFYNLLTRHLRNSTTKSKALYGLLRAGIKSKGIVNLPEEYQGSKYREFSIRVMADEVTAIESLRLDDESSLQVVRRLIYTGLVMSQVTSSQG